MFKIKSEYPSCFEYETAARSVLVEYPRLQLHKGIEVSWNFITLFAYFFLNVKFLI